MHLLTAVLPQRSDSPVTPLDWKHEVQQDGVGVPDVAVLELLTGATETEDGAIEEELP